MTEWMLKTTDADIDAALERARLNPAPAEARALSAMYDPALNIVLLHLDSGRRVAIPREELQGLENATPEQLAHVRIFGGLDIAWPDLDVNHYLPSLLAGVYGSDRWMQRRTQTIPAA